MRLMMPDYYFSDENDLLVYAARLANVVVAPFIIFLSGELGVGKTTFARGFLRALGLTEAVKSPTYTLIEPYHLGNQRIYHCDFYRLHDPEEFELLGLREELDHAIFLIEWAKYALPYLPSPDLAWHLSMAGEGRNAVLQQASAKGKQALMAMKKLIKLNGDL